MDSHAIAATEELVTYRNVCSKFGVTKPADYRFTVITTDEYNRRASPTSRDPAEEVLYIPGDLRGANYDKVNLFASIQQVCPTRTACEESTPISAHWQPWVRFLRPGWHVGRR